MTQEERIKLTAFETGTTIGYENYHGEMFHGTSLIASWSYDKRQRLYITSINTSNNSKKRFYHPSVHGLVKKVENFLNNQTTNQQP